MAVTAKSEDQDTGQNEQMLTNVLAACPVGLCQVEDRKFKWVNHAIVKMFGFRGEEDFVGKSTRMIYASQEEFQAAGAVLYQSLQGRTELETDAKLIRKDGSVFDGHIRISAPDPANLKKGTIVAITDRTPIKKAEAAVMESERRFRQILENLRLVAVTLNVNGDITFCNDFFLEITEWQREDVLGRNWFDIFASPKRDNIKCERWQGPLVHADVWTEGESEITTRTGESRCIRWNTTVYLRDSRGDAIGLASIGEDITERKQANALLLHTERIKAVGEMAGAVAHNFNNLLQVITCASQVAENHLQFGNISEATAEIEQIVKACGLGAQTVKRLQEFARIRKYDAGSDFTIFDLSFTVRQAVEMTRPWWRTNPEKDGITVSLVADLAPGCLVSGKENELFEVAVNLIKNAVEACPQGGSIQIRTFTDMDSVMFQIQDDGIGIAEANLGKVFQPFWTTKGFRGTGMGLSSSYGIVSRHRGNISVESAEGKDTMFTVTLPKVHSETDVALQATAAMRDLKLQVLVVDDMDALLKTIEDGLTIYGLKVFTARSGQEAIAIFNQEAVDAVICDLGMEGMNGQEVSRAVESICAQKGLPKIPFILLTGWGGQIADQYRQDRSGIDRIVFKPVSIHDLLGVLEEVVQECRSTVSRRVAGTNSGETP